VTEEETRLMRGRILACLKRLELREKWAVEAATFACGHRNLPRPYVRSRIRGWFAKRAVYLGDELRKLRS